MLSKTDYEAMAHTVYLLSNLNIQQRHEDFKKQVLQILSDLLNYHYSIFWKVNGGELEETPTVLNIKHDTLHDYLMKYKYYDPLHPMNMQNQPLIQLLDQHHHIPETKKNYYQNTFLKQIYFKDEMVMYLEDEGNLVAAIGLLRHQDEESFQLKDLFILNYLRKVLENVYLLHGKEIPQNLLHITMREEELLSYICKGYTNHEIAKMLFVSENTVKKHLQNLYRKCKVTNRTQLAMIYSKYYRMA